jgi:hypothetical protein
LFPHLSKTLFVTKQYQSRESSLKGKVQYS